MDEIKDILSSLVDSDNSLVGLGTLAASAAIEYVFPPFPGDFVTVLGAVLVTAYGWSFMAVLAAVMVGSVIGALAAYQVGVVFARRRAARPDAPPRPTLDALVARFERHGPAFVMVNRFLPGVRAFIFVAAGLAGMPRGKVILYAAISALAWNLGLMALGAALGANLDQLVGLVERYTLVVWIVIAVIVAALLVRRWRNGRRVAASADTPPR